MTKREKLRAIDLYSGVGGWSLGLRLAGIEVVASYERWGAANETNFKNNHHQAQTVDIRRLTFADLPDDIDIVVGSPPCTQFSYSNRGGNGDLDDGLEDIITFLRIVDHLRPSAWAMENVPRVAPIIERELLEGGRLHAFAHLGLRSHVLNLEDVGLPQRRRRCIAGNFDIDLLRSYCADLGRPTLGDVVTALNNDPVRDPLYGLVTPKSELVDHVPEEPLNPEELRINAANKTAHTVYNAMPFPDGLQRAVRTITATCTRVSRESIVIVAPEAPDKMRRLTVRERASLQGFPTTFQFYGETYAQKLRMIGNAVPPAFTYLLGHALQDSPTESVRSLLDVAQGLTGPAPPPAWTPPDRPGSKYPLNRSFRFAIQSLQLKSGVRFELRNRPSDDGTAWSVDFYFGTSKNIISLPMDGGLQVALLGKLSERTRRSAAARLKELGTYLAGIDVENMQRVWAHKGVGGTRPFMLLDELDSFGSGLVEVFNNDVAGARGLIDHAVAIKLGEDRRRVGIAKLHRNAGLIAAGLLLGSTVNGALHHRGDSHHRTSRTQPV